jgi:hypothetical protein
MKAITTSITAVLIMAGIALAQQPFDSLRVKDFQAGFGGDSEAFEALMMIIDEALIENPKNARAKVAHGIGIFRRAGDALQKGDMQASGKLYQAAIHEMEEAVQLEPNNIAVRVPRGAALITASRFMPAPMVKPLLESGLSDFEQVLKLQEQDQTSISVGLVQSWQAPSTRSVRRHGWRTSLRQSPPRFSPVRVAMLIKGTCYDPHRFHARVPRRAKDDLAAHTLRDSRCGNGQYCPEYVIPRLVGRSETDRL